MGRLFFKKCFRCSGFMIYDKFYGLQEHFWGWKCLNCGEIVDHVILENRGVRKTGQERGTQRARRQNKFYGQDA